MGTWDYGLLDSDPALDIVDLWNEEMVTASPGDPRRVEDSCFQRWGDAIRFGDSITNSEILALTALHLNARHPLSQRLKKVAIDAINRELVEEELDNWAEPERRRGVLLDLLKTLGGKVKRPRKPRFVRDASLYFKSIADAKSELLKMVKEARGLPWITYMVYRQTSPRELGGFPLIPMPPFLATLDRFMCHRIWEKDETIHWRATTERLMMLVTYLGISLKMTEEEISRLLDRCDMMKVYMPK